MKQLSYIASLAFLMSIILVSCRGNYEVGDIYRQGDIEGVVIRVAEDNGEMLVLSTDEAAGVNADSANVWASSFGDSQWHLPSKDEMMLIRKYRSLINQTLERTGNPKILTNHTFYWTSTSCSESHTFACGPDGVHCYFSTNSSPLYRARAVRIIRLGKD